MADTKTQLQEESVLTCSGTSVAGKRSETMAVNRAASSIRNLGVLLLRMAMINTTASSMSAHVPSNNIFALDSIAGHFLGTMV